MKKIIKNAIQACLTMGLILVAGQTLAQSSESSFFATTDALMQQANELDAELLSPKNYANANTDYAKAKDYYSDGRADKAQKELDDAQESLNEAIAAAQLGKVNFASTLKARELALSAEAPKYESKLWTDAEAQFKTAATRLESGDVNRATKEGDKATAAYGNAELAAIKTAIVGKARTLIAAADDNRVERKAPITLNKAKAAVAEAEADLDKSRYETAQPIALAAEAEYEAEHASYIASQLNRIADKDITEEGLMLEWEVPVQNVARALDVSTDMTEGYSKSSEASVAMATMLVADNAELTAAVETLQIQVGGTEAIVQETKRLQDQLNQVEALFTPEQARIVREGNNLVLRLVGLSFQSGQSVIETRYFGLLKKVQEAIEINPDAPIVIEGHTDSTGSDAVNMKLSQDRADSVREYLIANLGLPESRVKAVGYGKNRPIASNENEAGRAQNRRIDVVILDVRARLND